MSRKVKATLIIFVSLLLVALFLSGYLFKEWIEYKLAYTDIKYTPGEVQIEKITITGAVIIITKTWSNKSMPLLDFSYEAELIWHNNSLFLKGSDFLSKTATTTGGSIRFVDINMDSKISVGDKFYLGSETNGGAPLWSNTTYTFFFDDDSPDVWDVTFRTEI